MKKVFILGITAISAIAYLGIGKSGASTDFSDIELQNIEALSRGEDYAGRPCYNNGYFDIKYPETLVCGNPCNTQNYYLISTRKSTCPQSNN